MKSRVALVDDEAEFRQFIRDVIFSSGRYDWAGAYGSGEEALRELPRARPDFVLMDIVLPGMGGLDCARQLKREHPEMAVIMVSGRVSEEKVTEVLETGADGFLHKPFALAELFRTLQNVAVGGVGLSAMAAKHLVNEWRKRKAPPALEKYGITPREWEVLTLMSEGKLQKQTADILHVSDSTVHTHLRTVYVKLGVHNMREAIARLFGG